MYSIICHTLLHSGQGLLVGDPSVCEFYDRLFPIADINKGFLLISELPSGGYYAYHRSSNETPSFATDLLFLHDSITPDDGFFEKDLGLICAALSHSIFVCEENKAFNAKFSYFALEDEALYDVAGILSILTSKDTLFPAEKALMELCHIHSTDGFISGGDIISATGAEHVPDFLRTVCSTHWSVDIARRLSLVPAISVIGGMASNVYSEFVHVYMLYKDSSPAGIRICLETDETC